ncbi:flagellar hook-length control protein FliK [Alloyangia pacifica]|uniref:flagellar hook-length control protein FliK n=1 Tax=Alloyangia pacifica TaxID=311180 RepID=UPI001CFCAEF5|nr:flagellar hook-length control protein FliK [Alloyangia pacifica]
MSLAGVQHAAAKESVLPREQFPVGRPQNSMSPMRQVAEAIVAAEGARVELRLEPEELGRVRFHMQVSEQGVALQVSADRPETLDLLRRNADQLARYLSEAGYQGSRLDFSDERRSRRARGGSSSGASVAESDPVATPPLTPPAATDGLDLRL